jgi:hypothetical protein
MQLATVAQHAGVDLWNAKTSDGRSMRLAMDFLLPYATGEKTWPYKQINGFRELGAQILIRRAAEVYGDERYRNAVAKFPPLDSTDLDHLVGARLVPNEQDQQ